MRKCLIGLGLVLAACSSNTATNGEAPDSTDTPPAATATEQATQEPTPRPTPEPTPHAIGDQSDCADWAQAAESERVDYAEDILLSDGNPDASASQLTTVVTRTCRDSSESTNVHTLALLIVEDTPRFADATPEPTPTPKPTPKPLTAGQRNAIESAKSYLDYSAFSESGLIGQLEFEGYSTADATFAVQSLDVNWKKQAAKSAAAYLDYSAFSLSGLIAQLEYEGFTPEQATYGANKAYGN